MLNTKTLIFSDKAGIGYYVNNLYKGLRQLEDIVVLPTVEPSSVRHLSRMSRMSQAVRNVFGDSLLKIIVPVGDFLVGKRSGKGAVEADIYHETDFDAIPEGTWRSVATIHDLCFLRHPQFLQKQVVDKCRANLKSFLGADRLIVTTRAIKTEIRDLPAYADADIDIIPLAPSGNYYHIETAGNAGRNKIRQYCDCDYILFVGRIEPRKNIQVLIKAFSILKERDGLKLVIAGGKGWLYEDILRLPRQLGIHDRVVFTGYVDEEVILYLYNYAFAVVYPSLYEGFGIPALEAMSCGAPLIISDIPPLKEVAGGAAVVFSPTDHEELAHRIEMIVDSESLRKELKEKGIKRAAEFSWGKVINLTVETYRKALN